jgi:hypothetical protein
MDPVAIEYLDFDPDGSPVSIHINPGVVDGIGHDVLGGLENEVGGLLLGRVAAGPRPAVWIERYKRVHCEHRSGPEFILDQDEIAALEAAAANVLAAGDLAVVGLYRSHIRPGFQLEEPDFDLIRRYFNDSSDLILLIRPKSKIGISGQFHAWDEQSGAHPVGGEFPFRGAADEAEKTRPHESAVAVTAIPREALREHPRRLVPDFTAAPVEPPPSVFGLSAPTQSADSDELTGEYRGRARLAKWLPLLIALVMVGGVLWFVLQPAGHGRSNAAPLKATEMARPLGLYVDPEGDSWRVSWNPNATALHEARNVQLFVREKNEPGGDDPGGDDQNRIDLSARDLASGSRQYQPSGNDVTFRLEVTDQAGRVSAESFRLVRAVNAPAPSPAPRTALPPVEVPARTVQPRATYRAPAVVAAGVRSRIKGTMPIDVRVQIDTHGHVVSATSITRQHSGLEEYLAARAVQAAKLWRFEPARENGRPVAGTQILHFVFEK